MIKKLGVRKIKVFHPESPGIRVAVCRGLWGRLFKPTDFATLPEVLSAYREQQGGCNPYVPGY